MRGEIVTIRENLATSTRYTRVSATARQDAATEIFMRRLFLLGIVAAFVAAQASAATTPSEELIFSAHAFECQPFEFAELDSMPKEELQGAYCSYAVGAKQSSKRADLAKEKHKNNSTVLVGLIEDHVKFLDQCAQGMVKTSALLKRKYKQSTNDCTPMTEKLEAALSKSSSAAQNNN